MTVSPETLADNRAFCQRRYNRKMREADLLDNFARMSNDAGFFAKAEAYWKEAAKIRESVTDAARTVSERHERILREFQPKLEG